MDRETFLREHEALIESLRQCPHDPEGKIRLLSEGLREGWEDGMLIWALEAGGEEDVVIEIIAQRLGWEEERIEAALEAAGWPQEKVLRVYYKAMTGIG